MITRVAFYARVSSSRQKKDSTINSQLSELRSRIKTDGHTNHPDREFIDNGYSGSNLMRPGLEFLRDEVAAGSVDTIYVLSPDRLARNYAHQYLLMEEFSKSGAELVFLNGSRDESPEGSLLLQVQGVIAEYERAKILERNRRGKLHAAQNGKISVNSGAPYGYRYIKKNGLEPAYFVIDLEKSRVIRDVFRWIAVEKISLNEATKRLSQQGVPTPTGKNTLWNRASLMRMLKNPAYKGKAAFGKTKQVPRKNHLHLIKGSRAQGKNPTTSQSRDAEEWVFISVPAIVDNDIFEEVQLVLERNKLRKRERATGRFVLLRGLIVCGKCGYSFTANDGRYYLCTGTRLYAHKKRTCNAQSISMPELDATVWSQIKMLLTEPERVEKEYMARISELNESNDQMIAEVESREAIVKNSIQRLIDAYTTAVIEKSEFEPRIKYFRGQLSNIQNELAEIKAIESQKGRLSLALTHLREFRAKIGSKIDVISDDDKRKVVQALMDRIEINANSVEIVFAIQDFNQVSNDTQEMQHCCRSSNTATVMLLYKKTPLSPQKN